MKNLLIICIGITVITVLCSCPGKACFEANYSFSVNASIKPDLDSINVGDTIYILSSFSSFLKDNNSGQEINYTNATNLVSNVGIGRIEIGNPMPIDAVADFDYFSVNGRIYNDKNIASPDGVQQLSYEESNGMYKLKVGLIAKKPGIYTLGIGNGISTGRKGGRGCEKASFEISLKNTNQHLYLFQSLFPNHQPNNYEVQHAYYFKVN